LRSCQSPRRGRAWNSQNSVATHSVLSIFHLTFMCIFAIMMWNFNDQHQLQAVATLSGPSLGSLSFSHEGERHVRGAKIRDLDDKFRLTFIDRAIVVTPGLKVKRVSPHPRVQRMVRPVATFDEDNVFAPNAM